MMENQAKKKHPEDLGKSKQGNGPSRLEHPQSTKESETGTNQNHLAGNTCADKQNPPATEKDSSDQECLDTPKGNSHWPNESLSADGLVDREFGDGSEDLNDIDTDGDDELSFK